MNHYEKRKLKVVEPNPHYKPDQYSKSRDLGRELRAKYGLTYEEYRKKYQGWLAFKKQNNSEIGLEDYINRKPFQRDKPGMSRKETNMRRALAISLATPKWVDIEALIKVYINCPEGYEVDHIVPLRNKNVCGLHIPANLQYLSREENIEKRNKFKPYMKSIKTDK